MVRFINKGFSFFLTFSGSLYPALHSFSLANIIKFEDQDILKELLRSLEDVELGAFFNLFPAALASICQGPQFPIHILHISFFSVLFTILFSLTIVSGNVHGF